MELKKRAKRPSSVTAAAVDQNSQVGSPFAFYIEDKIAGTQFLVDTGAFCSIYPATSSDLSRQNNNVQGIVAANGSQIKTFGFRKIPLRLHDRSFEWRFIIANVQQPLLEADFLALYKLLVDVARKRLIDTDSFTSFPLAPASQEVVNACSPHPTGLYARLFDEYPEVFRAELKQIPGVAPKHGIVHRIKTDGSPVYSRFRRLPPDKLQIVKDYFAEMERMGICAKASSPWVFPLHMVPKPDSTYRPCGDYRRLNAQTESDHYPVPNIAI